MLILTAGDMEVMLRDEHGVDKQGKELDLSLRATIQNRKQHSSIVFIHSFVCRLVRIDNCVCVHICVSVYVCVGKSH